MQYLLHDLLKLPLADRLSIVEQVIGSLEQSDKAQALADMVQRRLAQLQAARLADEPAAFVCIK